MSMVKLTEAGLRLGFKNRAYRTVSCQTWLRHRSYSTNKLCRARAVPCPNRAESVPEPCRAASRRVEFQTLLAAVFVIYFMSSLYSFNHNKMFNGCVIINLKNLMRK